MTDGQTVWIAFATIRVHPEVPQATVTQGTVLDAENRVIKRENGQVTVFSDWSVETLHDSEAEAWAACHAYLSAAADRALSEAARCAQMAAGGRIVQVTA